MGSILTDKAEVVPRANGGHRHLYASIANIKVVRKNDCGAPISKTWQYSDRDIYLELRGRLYGG